MPANPLERARFRRLLALRGVTRKRAELFDNVPEPDRRMARAVFVSRRTTLRLDARAAA
ncbi:MAG: hypothetical protein AAFR35_12115 [Pseudomonadota bacterium]